jgi:hypothetical protein
MKRCDGLWGGGKGTSAIAETRCLERGENATETGACIRIGAFEAAGKAFRRSAALSLAGCGFLCEDIGGGAEGSTFCDSSGAGVSEGRQCDRCPQGLVFGFRCERQLRQQSRMRWKGCGAKHHELDVPPRPRSSGCSYVVTWSPAPFPSRRRGGAPGLSAPERQ